MLARIFQTTDAQSLAAQFPDGVLVVARNGVVAYANAPAADLLNCACNTLIGRPLPGFVIAGGETKETVLERAGKACVVEARGVAITWQGAPAVLAILRDVTDERAQSASQIRAGKLFVAAQLAGGVAHELNNLLAVILGNLQILSLRFANEAQARGEIDRALRGCESGTRLSARLLSLSGARPLETGVADIDALVKRCFGKLAKTLPRNIGLVVEGSDELCRAKIDVALFENALAQIAENGRDAMQGGGKLRIRTNLARIEETPPGASPPLDPGRYILVEIEDTGAGLTIEAREHLFEPFFTTKTDGRHLGLSLSKIRGFIEQLGGRIALESAARGTTVRIWLPEAAPSAAVPHADPILSPDSKGSETILIVDDDDDLRTTLSAYVESLGYRVIALAGPQAALAVLADGVKIDLMLTDIVMLDALSGIELSDRARQIAPDVKIVIMTGHADRFAADLNRISGNTPVLAKPFANSALAQCLRQTLDRRT